MDHSIRPELERLAELYGIEPRYHAIDGREVHASDDALLHALGAVGAPVSSMPHVPDALREVTARRRTRRLPKVSILHDGNPAEVRLRWRDGRLPSGRLVCRLEREDGRSLEWTVPTESLRRTGAAATVAPADGTVALPLPEPLPMGVHGLTVSGPDRERAPDEGWVIRAPSRVYEGDRSRTWGLFLPLHALRTRDDWGVGDLTGLDRLRQWAAARGARWIGTLPLLACYLDRPFDPSPYSPVSRLFWNELYVDAARAPELRCSAGARDLLASDAFRREATAVRASPIVDYRRAYAMKRQVLEALAQTAFEDGDRARVILSFARERPELVGYAGFRAAIERHGPDWWGRNKGAREPDLGILQDPIDPSVQYHLYAQWLTGQQIEGGASDIVEGGKAELYLDLPLGCHALGYDPWRWPELFAERVSVGAPPDDLAKDGQNWGFPPLQPHASRADAHGHWRAALRTLLRPAGALRVDHVMALHRLYWIPDGMPATEGVYVRYPAEELYALLALESHRHRCRIVGEDLGTVPEEVREAMDRNGLLRMYVLPFELTDAGGPRPVPEAVQASLGTHDTATFAGHVRGVDLRRREAEDTLEPDAARAEHQDRRDSVFRLERWLEQEGHLAGPDAVSEGQAGRRPAAGEPREPDDAELRELLLGCLRFLGGSSARLLLVNLEDLWLEERPQNVPGTGSEGGSWRGRARHRLEELDTVPEVTHALAEMERLRPGSDR